MDVDHALLTLSTLIVFFLLASGILAMIDAALLSVSHAEVEELVAKKKWGSSALRALTKHLTRALTVLVIATSSVNILGPMLIGYEATLLFSSRAIGVITALLTLSSIIVAEIIPKGIGAHYAPTISRTVAPVILGLVYILYPVVLILDKLVNVFKSGKRRIGTEEQIRALARIGGGEGHIEEDERQLIHRAFVLNDRRAEQIMVPRAKITAIHAEATVRKAASVVFHHPYSRYPVFAASLDDIRGVALSRDILQALAEDKDTLPVGALVREILFVRHDMMADDLLLLFRRKRIHIAIVQKDRQTIGLVTLEDVLEELVGEIEDEMDTRAAQGRTKG